jgi:hypothetical protein
MVAQRGAVLQMTSKSEREEILERAVAAIPKIVELIGTAPREQRASALEAAERQYLITARDLGYAEVPAQNWVSAVMFRLRAELEKREVAETKRLRALLDEVSAPSQGPAAASQAQ